MRIVGKPANSDGQLVESLVRMHVELLQPLEQQLTELLRHPLRVSLLSIDRRCFSESIVHASSPCCSMVLQQPGTADSWMVDIGPCLVLPIAHCLLGGNASLPLKPDRPFTPLERRLMRCIVRPLARILQQQWSGILSAPLELAGETAASRWFSGEEEVYQVVFSLSLEQHQGFMTLCMPAAMVESVADAVANWNSTAVVTTGEEETLPEGVQLSVHLPPSTIGQQDVEQLRVGEIVSTEIGVDQPLEMHVDGSPRFQAEAGQLDGQLTVRITGPLDPVAGNHVPGADGQSTADQAAG